MNMLLPVLSSPFPPSCAATSSDFDDMKKRLQSISEAVCPIDCAGTWNEWSACDSATATRTRTFQVTDAAKDGGKQPRRPRLWFQVFNSNLKNTPRFWCLFPPFSVLCFAQVKIARFRKLKVVRWIVNIPFRAGANVTRHPRHRRITVHGANRER